MARRSKKYCCSREYHVRWRTLQRIKELKDRRADCMNSENRIAVRHVFESRILIHFRRGNRKFSAQGWARDLSESGLGAFVAENLLIGEQVTLQVSLGVSAREVIGAKVSRQVGTQYGFQFTELSAEQRLGIQAALKGQKEIPYWHMRS